jgi:succinyl-diaminopimelate desuccinylase
LRAEFEGTLSRHGVDHEISWHLSGEPFLTAPGALRTAVREVLVQQCGSAPDENTAGGTSDGRFIAPLGVEVVEFGPINATIHKVDECVSVDDLQRLVPIYLGIAERLLA